jgi:hypothetical protein
MIPDKRIRKALLSVEKRQVLSDLTQLNAAILHLLAGGKSNYDGAKNSNNREEDYNNTSDTILLDLKARRQEREDRLNLISDELALLDKEE